MCHRGYVCARVCSAAFVRQRVFIVQISRRPNPKPVAATNHVCNRIYDGIKMPFPPIIIRPHNLFQ